LKISSAAEALNNAEMGLTSEDSHANEKQIMSISTDQIYFNEDKETLDKYQTPKNTSEAAAITIAKETAKKFLKDHPKEKQLNHVKELSALPLKEEALLNQTIKQEPKIDDKKPPLISNFTQIKNINKSQATNLEIE
jgi:hypothetical protein